MKKRRFWLAVVSAFLAAQNNTSEAATTSPDMGRDSLPVQTTVAEEDAVTALFAAGNYSEIVEIAKATWPKLNTMPERVLYCVSESYIRLGHVQSAKAGFEMLLARNPQNHSFRLGLAYTQLYAGEVEKGLVVYQQVLQENYKLLSVAAEDAVALLSQGNIGGGKALFQVILTISPEKQQYLQLYNNSLRMFGLSNDALSYGNGKGAAVKGVSSQQDDKKLQRDQAIEMAKNNQYQQSMEIMSRLFAEEPQDKLITYDYITILQWAGQNEQVVRLYQQQADPNMPFFVRRSVSAAYFYLHEYDKAEAVLQPEIKREERDALLWAGEMYLIRRDFAKARTYYDQLLKQNPNDYDVYMSRGVLSLKADDYQQATSDLERARRLVPDAPDKAARLYKVEHSLAIAYMHSNKNEKAASILRNYTKTMPVDASIASDYIVALSNSKQYEMAVQEGERLWTVYADVPIPGLRSLAESYIRLGKQEQAILLYRQLSEQQPNDENARRILGFQLMLNGRTTEGLSYYDELLAKSAMHADKAVDDAVTLLNTEKYIAGKMLFELVLKKYPNHAYRQQYAETLNRNNLNRAAFQQYEILAVQPEGELTGLSGMVRTAVALGNYTKSRQAMDTIINKYGRSKAVEALAKSGMERTGVEDTSPIVASYHGTQYKVLSSMTKYMESSPTTESAENKINMNEEFGYEMAQIAARVLVLSATDTENFKLEFSYAISQITAKVLPILPREQKSEFANEMAQITSKTISDAKLDVEKAKTEFAQLITKIVKRVEKIASLPQSYSSNSDMKPNVAGATFPESPSQTANNPGYIPPETYKGLLDELMQVGKSKSNADKKVKLDTEIRYHYAINGGADRWHKNSSGIRAYFGAETKINKNWNAYGMLEGQKNIINYNNELKLSRLYVKGKVGESIITAGSFGYLMADGNIYDSGFTGVRYDFGDPIQYTLSYGETNDTKATYVATVRYNDFDYNLEAGIYHYRLNDESAYKNTIWNFAGTYKFNDFRVGAMYLSSSQKDSSGGNKGYVLKFDYGDLHSYRPGTYNLFAKYYNQARGTYIAHGMNGIGNSMQGFKGYGMGMYYTLAKDLVGGVEYYRLTDRVSGETAKTLWMQVTHYF